MHSADKQIKILLIYSAFGAAVIPISKYRLKLWVIIHRAGRIGTAQIQMVDIRKSQIHKRGIANLYKWRLNCLLYVPSVSYLIVLKLYPSRAQCIPKRKKRLFSAYIAALIYIIKLGSKLSLNAPDASIAVISAPHL